MNIGKINLTLAGIIIIGTIFRLYNLTAVSLWHDEAFSALLIRYPFWEMIERIALDVHPPLYYLVLRLWDFAFGDTLFSLRLFSAFWGILAVYFVYLFIKTAFKNERLALISAALIAVNPFQIQYATEARMYTFGVFLVVFSSWLLIKALDSKEYKLWFFYGIAASAAIYTHYYLIFSIAAQALFILYRTISVADGNYRLKFFLWLNSRNVIGAVIAYTTAFLVFLPWLKIFLKQLSQVEQNYWIPKMTASSVPNTLWKMFAGSNIEVGNSTLATIAIAFLFILYAVIKRQQNNYKWLIVFSFIIPFALAIVLSFKRSLYLDRYFVFAGLFYLMIFALFIETIANKLVRNAVLTILAASSLFLFVQNWKIINPANKPGMKGAAEYVLTQNLLQDKVYIASSFIFFTFKYYNQQYYSNPYFSNNVLAKPLLYTPGVTKISQLPHFSGTALLNNSDLLSDFNRDARQGDIIWLLWTTGFGGSKPDVPENWKQIEEAGFEDVFGYRGWIMATKYEVP